MKPNSVRDFWLKVDRKGENDCWPWRGRTNNAGQGIYPFNNTMTTAHRLSWAFTYGDPGLNKTPILRDCGNPLCVNPRHLRKPPALPRSEFFLSKAMLDLKTGCMVWKMGINRFGYGLFLHRLAHRASWEIHNGPIPSGLNVLHRCDNPPCVNPDHLFLGTQRDNVLDMLRKGRSNYTGGGPKAGVKHFSDEQVRSIRSMYNPGFITQKEIGERFGVCPSVISRIVKRLWYKAV